MNSLEEALLTARLGDMPPAINEQYNKHWLKAIVKVRRSNGETGCCLAVNDGNGKPRIVRDFQPTAIIIEIVSIHPYEEAVGNIIPHFKNDAQVVKYLCKSGYDHEEVDRLIALEGKSEEQIKTDRDILKGYIRLVATRQAQIKSESDEQARRLVEMADPKLKEKNIKAKKYGRTAAPRKTKGSKGKD